MRAARRPLAARLALATVLATASACATASAVPTTPSAARVDGSTARSLSQQGALLVDVRRPDEFAAGHLPGAINVPYDQVGSRTAEIGPTSATVVVYCRSGRRSAVAAETLRNLGYVHVYDLGPMSAWPDEPSPGPQ